MTGVSRCHDRRVTVSPPECHRVTRAAAVARFGIITLHEPITILHHIYTPLQSCASQYTLHNMLLLSKLFAIIELEIYVFSYGLI